MSSLFGIGGGGNVGSAGGSFYSYSIDQSLRLDKASSANLSFTPSSAGSTNTGTISVWLKRTQVGTYQIVYQANGGTYDTVWINTNDQLQIILGSTSTAIVGWNRKFRDTGSWGHLVIKLDVSNGTANQRIIAYWNGEDMGAADLPSNTSYPASSAVFGGWFKNAVTQRINFEGGSTYGDGYVAEMHVIDGTALDATSFGEEVNGVWRPVAYDTADGAYGTNGFYLSFADSAAIGDDLSGNTNDWTANNLAASDVLPDSPTNNFATLNANFPHVNMTFSEGNLKWSTTVNNRGAMGNFAIPIGTGQKYYFEYVQNGWGGSSGDDAFIGLNVDTVNIVGTRGGYTTSYSYGANQGNKRIAGSETSYGTAWGTGDVIGIAVDRENNTINFAKNNTFHGTFAIPATGNLFAWVGSGGGSGNANGVFNFGQDSSFAGTKSSGSSNATDDNGIGDFFYAPPSTFLALATSSLPEPAIGPNSTEQADDYFNTVLYTGTGASNSITGVGFQPDWTWIKGRSNADYNYLVDSVRGYTERLFSNLTDGASVEANTVASSDSDGFTLGTDAGVNRSSSTYVAWNWKAGGTAVSNTDGDITSSVSAAPDAGFSIVTYTGNATAGATVGHGLGKKPTMIIVKNRDNGAQDWPVQHGSIGATGQMVLSSTGANSTNIVYWNNTEPTSSVFSLGTASNTNQSGNSHVAYLFTDIDGYSATGSYVGNGNADGTFVYTGFRPAFLLIGKTAVGGGWNWQLRDAVRGQFNVDDNELRANTGDAESSSSAETIDFLSNGFKPRSANGATNENSYTYIYLAIGDSFKYANAR